MKARVKLRGRAVRNRFLLRMRSRPFLALHDPCITLGKIFNRRHVEIFKYLLFFLENMI